MRKLLLTLVAALSLLAANAQSAYISNSRDENNDSFENLNGRCGLLLISMNKSLMVNITNSSKQFEIIRPTGKNAKGMYEYRILTDPDDTRQLKVEVNRMSDVYKTEFIANVKPDFFVAYTIEEVADPIRIEDRTQSNDAILNAKEAAIEFTTTISGLTIKCDPRLNATMTTEKSKADATVNVTTVVLPIAQLQAAKDAFSAAQAEYDRLTGLIEEDKATDADYDKHDEAEKNYEAAQRNLSELATVTIFSDNTNRLSIDISDLGPRSKKCYIVMPVEIEKEVFVTEANAYVNEGSRLFDQRKYAEARVAYVNAINANDVQPNMKPSISASIAMCDTCMQYEKLAALSISKLMEMKDNNTATQQQTARYAAAAIEFLGMVNTYNPDIFYTSRITKLNNMLKDMPLMVTFTTVEWRTFEEGEAIPDVEVWAYYGDTPPTPSEMSGIKKLRRTMDKNPGLYEQKGVSDGNGKLRMSLIREKLPKGFIFCPTAGKDIKAVYLTFDDLIRQAKGTYLEKQFRLKMYRRTNKYF